MVNAGTHSPFVATCNLHNIRTVSIMFCSRLHQSILEFIDIRNL